MKYLIDTNIIIDHLRGDTAITSFFEGIENKKIKASVSVINEYELLSLPSLSASQEQEIISFLNIFAVLNVTSSIVRSAARFRRKYGSGLVDSLIAATTHKNKSILVTRNTKHFKNIKEIRIQSI